jgi:hypothetical protein
LWKEKHWARHIANRSETLERTQPFSLPSSSSSSSHFSGPPKDAAEMAADDADLPLWEEEWEDEDACDFVARLKSELAGRAGRA